MMSGTAGNRTLIVTGLLVILFVMLAARDIDRPFYGLHSWDAAIPAWAARAHVNYGLGYTRGLCTLAVGNPPPATPQWYLDHPQLAVLLDAAAMKLFGVNERALRLEALLATALSLPLLVGLLSRLYGEGIAVLAGFLYVLFPITSFFYSACWTCWVLPCALVAWRSYLILIGDLVEPSPSRKLHMSLLGATLFIMLQLYWVGLFYAAAIGTHYILWCFSRRRYPDRALLLVLVLCPLSSFALDVGILLAGRGESWRSLVGLYTFRSHVSGTRGRDWNGWFAVQWKFLKSNFTLPVVLLLLVYPVFALIERRRARKNPPNRATGEPAARGGFHHAWLFVVPGVLNMVVFSEWFWAHQFVYMWLSVGVAIAGAFVILRLREALLAGGERLANVAMAAILAVIVGYCAAGLDSYYERRWRSSIEIDLMKRLNKETPPDHGLLTYRQYVIQDHPNKIAHYRPELAWYLDRPMVVARTLEEIERQEATGKFTYYLAEVPLTPQPLIDQLTARYAHEFIKGVAYQPEPLDIAGLNDQMLFDLRARTVDALMKTGLDALFKENNPGKAAESFAGILEREPNHYGGNFQMARVLDVLGKRDKALPYWSKTLELAHQFKDDPTIAAAEKRLNERR
jgi:hypothetical protein